MRCGGVERCGVEGWGVEVKVTSSSSSKGKGIIVTVKIPTTVPSLL